VAAAPRSPLAQLRKIALALPEAHEVEAWGAPTFRVKNKVFAMFAEEGNHHHDGRPGAWIKSAHVTQDMLVRAQPTHYFKPPYVGPKGWVGAFLDKNPDWEVVADLLRDAWMQTAPKKLVASLPSTEAPAKKVPPAPAAESSKRVVSRVKSAQAPKKLVARAKSAQAPKKRR